MFNRLNFCLLLSGISFSTAVFSQVNNYNIENQANIYDAAMCVANYRNACVDQICQTSERRDCQDLCLQGAVAKCEAQDQEPNPGYYY